MEESVTLLSRCFFSVAVLFYAEEGGGVLLQQANVLVKLQNDQALHECQLLQ